MSSSEKLAPDSRYWAFPIVRALPAALLAIVITFSADHSARFGLLLFGGFAVVAALVFWLASRTVAGPVTKSAGLAQGIVSVLAGASAIGAVVLVDPTPADAQLALFVVVVLWGLATGMPELVGGLRARRGHPAARDAVFMGSLTVLLALAVLLVPQDYAESFAVPQGASGVVTASVMAVGVLGAYGAITAVYLVIAGISLKPASVTATQEETTP